MTDVDLDAYFERIGYSGPRTATLDVLRALHRLHPAAIPFENLSPFSAAGVQLDLASLQSKLVRDRRGGYCFEQNGLFLEVLRALGFDASGLAARVLWGLGNVGDPERSERAVTARSHMLLRVELPEGTYVADVGFGVIVLTTPLRLEEDVVQETPHEPFRLVRAPNGDLHMQALIRDQWEVLYGFDLRPAYPVDYEVGNWWVSTYPTSHFRTNLMVARVLPARRCTLRNRTFNIHQLGGRTESREIQTPAELVQILESEFEINVPRTPEMSAAFERLF